MQSGSLWTSAACFERVARRRMAVHFLVPKTVGYTHWAVNTVRSALDDIRIQIVRWCSPQGSNRAVAGTGAACTELGFSAFVAKHAPPGAVSFSYPLCGGRETMILTHAAVEKELATFDSREERGELRRNVLNDVGDVRCSNSRFWRDVPGVAAHAMGLGISSKEHADVFARKLTKLYGDLPMAEPTPNAMRVSARALLDSAVQSGRFETDLVGAWTFTIVHEKIFGKPRPSIEDGIRFVHFAKEAVDMWTWPEPIKEKDKCTRILQEKRGYVEQFASLLDIDHVMAAHLVDSFIFDATLSTPMVLNTALAILHMSNGPLAPGSFVLDESNAALLVWETIRRFPPNPGIGYYPPGTLPT